MKMSHWSGKVRLKSGWQNHLESDLDKFEYKGSTL